MSGKVALATPDRRLRRNVIFRYGLYIKAMSLKVDDNEICYKNLFEKERRFQFCDITGCELKKEMLIYRIVCYKEKEVIAKVLVTAKNADLF